MRVTIMVVCTGAAVAGCGGHADSSGVAGVSCRKTEEAAAISVEDHGAIVVGCGLDGGAQRSTWEGRGSITSVDGSSFDLDTCDAESGCGGQRTVVHLSAPDLDLRRSLEPGILVVVRGEAQTTMGCSVSLFVESLSAWNGLTNPSPSASGLYVAAFDGGTTVPGAPYRIDSVRLDCAFDDSPYACNGPGNPTGLFASKLTPNGQGAAATLPMGETVSVPLPSSSERWRARNLRSFQTSLCDDYWNWAHWVVRDL